MNYVYNSQYADCGSSITKNNVPHSCTQRTVIHALMAELRLPRVDWLHGYMYIHFIVHLVNGVTHGHNLGQYLADDHSLCILNYSLRYLSQMTFVLTVYS